MQLYYQIWVEVAGRRRHRRRLGREIPITIAMVPMIELQEYSVIAPHKREREKEHRA